MKSLICAVFLVPFVLAAPNKPVVINAEVLSDAPFKQCGGLSTVSAVRLSSTCTTVCPLKKGTSVTLEVDFFSGEETKTLESVCHGIIGGIPLPFPLPNSDGCKDSGISCPVKKGQKQTFKTAIQVKSSYPSVQLIVKWEEKDDKKNDLFCIVIPAKIVS